MKRSNKKENKKNQEKKFKRKFVRARKKNAMKNGNLFLKIEIPTNKTHNMFHQTNALVGVVSQP